MHACRQERKTRCSKATKTSNMETFPLPNPAPGTDGKEPLEKRRAARPKFCKKAFERTQRTTTQERARKNEQDARTSSLRERNQNQKERRHPNNQRRRARAPFARFCLFVCFFYCLHRFLHAPLLLPLPFLYNTPRSPSAGGRTLWPPQPCSRPDSASHPSLVQCRFTVAADSRLTFLVSKSPSP